MTIGQIVAIPLLLMAAGFLFQIVRRPLIGLWVLICCTILFDQFLAGPGDVFYKPSVYDNFNKSLGIRGLVINPPEILLSLIMIGWAVQAFSGKLPGRPLRLISVVSIAWCGVVAFAALWGMQKYFVVPLSSNVCSKVWPASCTMSLLNDPSTGEMAAVRDAGLHRHSGAGDHRTLVAASG